jgi:hypothetical protein
MQHIRYNFYYYHGMARPQVADERDGLQMWRIAANMLNRRAEKATSHIGNWVNG